MATFATDLILAVLAVVVIVGVLGGDAVLARMRPVRQPQRPAPPALRLGLRAGYRLGYWILAALAVLTAVEFWVAVDLRSLGLLVLLALFKAALIMEYFMHMSHVWHEEEE